MFRDKLYIINEDLANHHRKKSEIMEKAVSERLDKALLSYIDGLNKSYDYLQYRDNVRVLRKMNRG
jgi:hypothetical protein